MKRWFFFSYLLRLKLQNSKKRLKQECGKCLRTKFENKNSGVE